MPSLGRLTSRVDDWNTGQQKEVRQTLSVDGISQWPGGLGRRTARRGKSSARMFFLLPGCLKHQFCALPPQATATSISGKPPAKLALSKDRFTLLCNCLSGHFVTVTKGCLSMQCLNSWATFKASLTFILGKLQLKDSWHSSLFSCFKGKSYTVHKSLSVAHLYSFFF